MRLQWREIGYNGGKSVTMAGNRLQWREIALLGGTTPQSEDWSLRPCRNQGRSQPEGVTRGRGPKVVGLRSRCFKGPKPGSGSRDRPSPSQGWVRSLGLPRVSWLLWGLFVSKQCHSN